MIRAEIQALEAMCQKKLDEASSAIITLEPQNRDCPQCLKSMRFQKSRIAYPVTLKYGQLTTRVVTYACPNRCRNFNGNLETQGPEVLRRLVPKGSNYGYDVEVFVGIERWLNHRQREEIRDMLATKKISISTGEISNQARRFVEHFGKLHRSRSDVLGEKLLEDGGYPLHIDATCEDGSGTILVAMAGWRKWILGSWKLTTECSDQIKPRLHEIADRYGVPLAIVRDLGKAMISAADEFAQEEGVAILILACHFHFLKDVGKDLLSPAYDRLRNLFRDYAIKTALRKLVREWYVRLGKDMLKVRRDVESWMQKPDQWAFPQGLEGLAVLRSMVQSTLDQEAESNHLRFPFEMPLHRLYTRCCLLRRACNAFMKDAQGDVTVRRALERVIRITDPVISDKEFSKIDEILVYRSNLFDKLRSALRLDLKQSKSSDSERSKQAQIKELNDVKESIRRLKISLRHRYPKRGPAQDKREAIDLVLKHFKAHQPYLWGHIIKLGNGDDIKVICRTQNDIEGLFGVVKQGERRRSGRKVLKKDFEDMLEDAFLVQNLKHEDYVETLCGSIDNLPEAFSELDYNEAHEIKKQKDENINEPEIETASLSKRDRAFIRRINIQERIQAAASRRVPIARIEARN